MFSFLEETLLREYFLYGAVLGRFTPSKQLFSYLAKAFDVSAKRANALFKLTEQEAVAEIETEADANRYKRINQLLQETAKPELYDASTDALITVKSEAIAVAAKAEACLNCKATQGKVYQVLLERASVGSIDALRILGVLQLNGLFVEENRAVGIENLLKAAQWGDVMSMFLLIRAGVNVDYVNRNFYAVAHNTPYSVLLGIAQLDGAQGLRVNAEIALLDKLFNNKLVNKNVYSPAHAHVLYATGISREDKEKILLSENKQLLSDVVNLPIYRPVDELHCQIEAIRSMPLHREKEQRKIIAALQNADLRGWSNYKPLCLVANSIYLQRLYAKAIEGCFRGEMVERIYFAELQDRDFEPTANNVFVRSCKCVSDNERVVKQKNDTGNVFLLFLNGELSDTILRRVKDFLSVYWRRQVRLSHPTVTLNFSYALPICICDSANAKKLNGLVETVKIADVDSDETSKIVGEMLSDKAQSYFGRSVEVTDKELLTNVSLEAAEEIINAAFMTQRASFKGADKVAFAIKPFVDSYERHHVERGYGFGGFNK